MAHYVPAGSDLIDIMGGGMINHETQSWLHQESQNTYQSLAGVSRQFFDTAKEAYKVVTQSQAAHLLRNIVGKTKSLMSGNDIYPIHDVADFQTATPYMQRWVMAEPTVRQRYLDQTLDGYSETYQNMHGDTVGESHYDYRRVMSGVVVTNDPDSTHDYTIRHYSDMMHAGEEDLTTFQKVDILRTWDRVKDLLQEEGEDPTSTWGSML